MLDAKFYDSLRGLRLAVGHKSSMNLSGNRKSVQKGASAEFSDFREYLPGDDIRRIDWNAYGRLDRLYIKEYMEEKEALVSILIDTSASMDYGSRKKSRLACELAAVLAYLSLNNMDRVAVYDMRRMRQPYELRGGKRAFPGLVRWLGECARELPSSSAISFRNAFCPMPWQGGWRICRSQNRQRHPGAKTTAQRDSRRRRSQGRRPAPDQRQAPGLSDPGPKRT